MSFLKIVLYAWLSISVFEITVKIFEIAESGNSGADQLPGKARAQRGCACAPRWCGSAAAGLRRNNHRSGPAKMHE